MKQLDPKAIWLFFINFVFKWFFAFIFLAIYGIVILLDTGKSTLSFNALNLLWVIIPVFFMLLAFCWIWAKLSYRFYKYELKEDGFRKEQGVIWKKYVTIPYDRIQNVDIYRGLIARILGLSDLNIQTAGASMQVSGNRILGGGAEGRLPGLSFEDAEQLRDELIRRAKQLRGQGL